MLVHTPHSSPLSPTCAPLPPFPASPAHPSHPPVTSRVCAGSTASAHTSALAPASVWQQCWVSRSHAFTTPSFPELTRNPDPDPRVTNACAGLDGHRVRVSLVVVTVATRAVARAATVMTGVGAVLWRWGGKGGVWAERVWGGQLGWQGKWGEGTGAVGVV